jgi:hypothetical protein
VATKKIHAVWDLDQLKSNIFGISANISRMALQAVFSGYAHFMLTQVSQICYNTMCCKYLLLNDDRV